LMESSKEAVTVSGREEGKTAELSSRSASAENQTPPVHQATLLCGFRCFSVNIQLLCKIGGTRGDGIQHPSLVT
jgi:hypothetical protein